MSVLSTSNSIKDLTCPLLNWTPIDCPPHYHPRPNPHHPHSGPTYYSIDY